MWALDQVIPVRYAHDRGLGVDQLHFQNFILHNSPSLELQERWANLLTEVLCNDDHTTGMS
jgi:hypothetical protein